MVGWGHDVRACFSRASQALRFSATVHLAGCWLALGVGQCTSHPTPCADALVPFMTVARPPPPFWSGLNDNVEYESLRPRAAAQQCWLAAE